ncbi:hypothetical protein J1614_002205 [Plenodomus biglobosus]|nr:hypothetical protein J1614_002205 [Plenodomus biglobosus]
MSQPTRTSKRVRNPKYATLNESAIDRAITATAVEKPVTAPRPTIKKSETKKTATKKPIKKPVKTKCKGKVPKAVSKLTKTQPKKSGNTLHPTKTNTPASRTAVRSSSLSGPSSFGKLNEVEVGNTINVVPCEAVKTDSKFATIGSKGAEVRVKDGAGRRDSKAKEAKAKHEAEPKQLTNPKNPIITKKETKPAPRKEMAKRFAKKTSTQKLTLQKTTGARVAKPSIEASPKNNNTKATKTRKHATPTPTATTATAARKSNTGAKVTKPDRHLDQHTTEENAHGDAEKRRPLVEVSEIEDDSSAIEE